MVAFITWQESLTAVQEGFRKHQKRSLDKEATTTQMPIMTAKIHEENDKKHKLVKDSKKSTKKNTNKEWWNAQKYAEKASFLLKIIKTYTFNNKNKRAS